jgi:undecaprenyl-diphosphatase
VFVWLSRVGTLGAIWLALALLATFLWRRPTMFPLVLLGVLVADGASFLIKQQADVPRPPTRYPEPEALVPVVRDASFPSGHAATSFVGAALIARAAPRRVRIALYALAAGIAFSRVYVGVHYPLDVFAGAALGLGVARVLPWLAAAFLRLMPTRSRGDSASGDRRTWARWPRSWPR